MKIRCSKYICLCIPHYLSISQACPAPSWRKNPLQSQGPFVRHGDQPWPCHLHSHPPIVTRHIITAGSFCAGPSIHLQAPVHTNNSTFFSFLLARLFWSLSLPPSPSLPLPPSLSLHVQYGAENSDPISDNIMTISDACPIVGEIRT